jgi:type VI secretion system protein ImpM
MQSDEVTGWYGKLPSLGDFASRRLAPAFVEPWDDWLAAGLAAWREQAPDGWLDGYLASPSWRFVLMPGVLPGASPDGLAAWAGVLMPSVDRVGRYFPLTLARPLPALPADQAQLHELLGWLQRLDDLALDALHDDWPLERLEAELARLGAWKPPPTEAAAAGLPESWAASARLDIQPAGGVAALLAASARHALLHGLHAKALWLSDDGEGKPVLRITAGLPGAAEFSNLIGRTADPTPATPSDLRGTA